MCESVIGLSLRARGGLRSVVTTVCEIPRVWPVRWGDSGSGSPGEPVAGPGVKRALVMENTWAATLNAGASLTLLVLRRDRPAPHSPSASGSRPVWPLAGASATVRIVTDGRLAAHTVSTDVGNAVGGGDRTAEVCAEGVWGATGGAPPLAKPLGTGSARQCPVEAGEGNLVYASVGW